MLTTLPSNTLRPKSQHLPSGAGRSSFNQSPFSTTIMFSRLKKHQANKAEDPRLLWRRGKARLCFKSTERKQAPLTSIQGRWLHDCYLMKKRPTQQVDGMWRTTYGSIMYVCLRERQTGSLAPSIPITPSSPYPRILWTIFSSPMAILPCFEAKREGHNSDCRWRGRLRWLKRRH